MNDVIIPKTFQQQLHIDAKKIYMNLPPETLVQQTLALRQGTLSDKDALCVNTGEFTGRSPKDKFIVHESETSDTVNWGDINKPVTMDVFDNLQKKILQYFSDKELWIRNVYACAHPQHILPIRVVNETPWANLFCYNLFIRETEEKISTDDGWQILHAPGFNADPETDGTRSSNFTIICFSKKTILIGGSAYTGEMKKGIFTVLNFLLPTYKNVLSMHCSANEGKNGEVALFFGLSGTGKTTLSADADRRLIGDDEHGWDDNSVFNFEGGCYAKCVHLSEEKEPQIFNAVRSGTLMENTCFYNNSNRINYDDISITENTRAAYPIFFMDNIKTPSRGTSPKNIFFLTCDAFGVLPPISKLTRGQTMFHFVSGYTAKIAGTEMGINEPQPVFSACFGSAFLPLHPVKYAELMGNKMKENPEVNVWLINTGWVGGVYGIGNRISLKITRTLINAAINNEFDNVAFKSDPIFNLQIPISCNNVPGEILHPKNSWSNKEEYDKKALELAALFNKNFEKYIELAGAETRAGAPKTSL